MNDDFDDIDEEDFYPHMHNFSALNSIPPKTEEELSAENKKKKVMEKIHRYDMLFAKMESLMYESYLRGEDLDKTYDELKRLDSYL